MKDSPALPENIARLLNPEHIELQTISAHHLVLPSVPLGPLPVRGIPVADSLYPGAPLMVAYPNNDNRPVVVDGCKRLQQGRAAGIKHFPCGIVRGIISIKEFGLLRILLNRGRTASFRERYTTLFWLNNAAPDCLRQPVLGLLGFSPGEVHDFMPLLSPEAGDDILALVESGKLDFGNIRAFLDLTFSDRDAVSLLLRTNSFSVQSQRDLLAWIPEIASCRNKKIPEVCSLIEIAPEKKGDRENAPQRARRIHDAARTLRFPHLTHTQQQWQRCADKVNPERTRVRFTHTPCFEHDRLDINVTVESAAQARRLFLSLSEIPVHDMETLISPFRNRNS